MFVYNNSGSIDILILLQSICQLISHYVSACNLDDDITYTDFGITVCTIMVTYLFRRIVHRYYHYDGEIKLI